MNGPVTQRSPYVPPGLTFSKSTFYPRTVFIYFMWIWEQTAIISLYSIDWLVFITETECVYCAVRTGYLNVTWVICFIWIWEQTAIISLYSINWLVFRHFRKIAKSSYWLRHVCPSPPVRPHGITRHLLDGFLWNLIFEYFLNPWRENSSSIKIWQQCRVLYMKTCVHSWSYLTQFFLQWEIIQTHL